MLMVDREVGKRLGECDCGLAGDEWMNGGEWMGCDGIRARIPRSLVECIYRIVVISIEIPNTGGWPRIPNLTPNHSNPAIVDRRKRKERGPTSDHGALGAGLVCNPIVWIHQTGGGLVRWLNHSSGG